MEKLAYVILNYNNYLDTKRCVDSILNLQNYYERYIVIVDNNSIDDSFERLCKNYSEVGEVKLLHNEYNYGFSKGNNIGCAYARDNYDVKILCVINNDTFVTDLDFERKIAEAYQKSSFDLLAPKIWNIRKNYNQNPFLCPKNKDEVTELIKTLKKNGRFLRFGSVAYYLACKLNTSLMTGQSLSGTACIFSEHYINKYNKIFEEKTFMYGEEAFLYQRILKDSLKIIYDNNVVIYHSDGGSTDKRYKSKKVKWEFQNEKMIQAYEALLSFIEEE